MSPGGDDDELVHTTFSEVVSSEDQLTDAVLEWLRDMEAQGWRPTRFHNRRGIRYWCPCDKQHNAWVSTTDAPRTFFQRDRMMLSKRSCYEYDEPKED